MNQITFQQAVYNDKDLTLDQKRELLRLEPVDKELLERVEAEIKTLGES